MTLNEAKAKCADILEKVTKLYAEKSERIIIKDIELYIQNHPGATAIRKICWTS